MSACQPFTFFSILKKLKACHRQETYDELHPLSRTNLTSPSVQGRVWRRMYAIDAVPVDPIDGEPSIEPPLEAIVLAAASNKLGATIVDNYYKPQNYEMITNCVNRIASNSGGDGVSSSRVPDGIFLSNVPLGQGSFSTVYRVLFTSGVYALKMLRQHKHATSELMHEVCLLRALALRGGARSHIMCQMHYVFMYRNHWCIAFDLMEANLCVRLSQTGSHPSGGYVGFTEQQVVNTTQQLLQGLHFLHMNNIVHGDITPANILLDSNGVVRLADFGSSLPLSIKRYSYIPCVTALNYRPPEGLVHARGKPTAGAYDMWSLGCSLFEIYQGTRVFEAHDEYAMLYQITSVLGPLPCEMVATAEERDVFFTASADGQWMLRDTSGKTLDDSRRRIDGVSLRAHLHAVGHARGKSYSDALIATFEHMLVLDPTRRALPSSLL